ncbi:hypothetical protein CVT25_006874 [Psilocybe cyanescens]|uniref:Uncharacterized protein n=1 Tax=Psilocybe cyanescens TaxID=93625 RepID=A0A409XU57_PSICY|nr:hypothetical protein CVT25_006874 [Psilocybe cyanescens]
MPSIDNPVSVDPVVASRFLQCWLVGNILGATAYGISLTLSWNCLILLSKPTSMTSIRMRRVMVTLIGFMCMLSTAAFILATGGVVSWSKNGTAEGIVSKYGTRFWGEPYSPVELILIVLATWCCDGFMIWRCVMLYGGVSRRARIAVMTFVTLLTMTSLAIGICALVTFTPVKWQIYSILTLFELISLMANGSIACLIIARIVYHQHYLRKIFGSDYGTAYTKIMSILIESASLTLVLSLVHIVLAAAYGRTISPILIIFRVAQGRTWQADPTGSLAPISNGLELGQLSSLKFADNDAYSIMTHTTLDDSRVSA